MKNSSLDNLSQHRTDTRGGFTLMEVVTALAILSFMSVTTLTVVKQAMTAAADTSVRMQALEVARENMEEMLSSTKVKEGADFGESEKYPTITWETTVENFPEPVSQRMWVRVVCGAGYIDSNDVEQKIELTHWITSVSKDQLLKIMADEQNRRSGSGQPGTAEPGTEPTDTTNSDVPDEWWDMDIGEIIKLLQEQGKLN